MEFLFKEVLKLNCFFRSFPGDIPIRGEPDLFVNIPLLSNAKISSSSLCMIELDDYSFSFILSLFILFSLDLLPPFGDLLDSSSELSDSLAPISS